MKKAVLIIAVLVILSAAAALSACGRESAEFDFSEAIRIHIRANGNGEEDQAVKLKVRNEIITLLTPALSECASPAQAAAAIENKLLDIENVAVNTLRKNGFDYGARASLKKEEFPERRYLGLTFEAGVYRALIVELGEAKGENWWCVAFPPLCFVPEGEGEKITLKSKILEIIEKYFKSDN
ncbi:MAG TPA: stage II sporulation protein R [Eubacteriales bacterium]|jgi:stage II sporulation protein R|nr:stage II sporulation protein R [Eubacteriales bacterium]HRU83764.1 stage II sporulation protein R [Eubacteriales bacterium]